MKSWTLLPCAILGAAAGGALVKKVWLEKYHTQTKRLDAAGRESDLLYTWLLLKQKGIGPEEYFVSQGYQTAAILGMGREGRQFFESIRNSENISIAYGVDAGNFAAVHETLTVYRLGDDPLPDADCMVICDLEQVPERLETAHKEFPGKIITLAQVLAWLLEQHQIKPWDGAVRDWPPVELAPSVMP